MSLELTEQSVQKYILNCGGKVRNHDLVSHFKKLLNDPVNKAANREKFKECISAVATVKSEDGEKVIYIKKKFNNVSIEDLPPPPPPPPITYSDLPPPPPDPPGYNDDDDDLESNCSSNFFLSRGNSIDSDVFISREPSIEEPDTINNKLEREPSIIITTDDGNTSCVHDSSRESSTDPENTTVLGESPIRSVKARAQELNQLTTDFDATKLSVRTIGRPKKSKDDSQQSENDESVIMHLGPVEREWLICSAKADYQPMAKMLLTHPELAKKKDCITGYTPLHWACKHGKPEVVKLLAGTYKTPVNPKSHGGYTPLHLAAKQNHEEVIELMVHSYGADVNIRDNSGKRPKQYLPNSASARSYLSQPLNDENFDILGPLNFNRHRFRPSIYGIGVPKVKRSGSKVGAIFNVGRNSFRKNNGAKHSGGSPKQQKKAMKETHNIQRHHSQPGSSQPTVVKKRGKIRELPSIDLFVSEEGKGRPKSEPFIGGPGLTEYK